jgi:hypothetical protein
VTVILRLTVSQSVLVSNTNWGSWPSIYYSLTVTVFVFLGGPLWREDGPVCLLYILLALARVVFLGSESLGTRDHILLSQIWDFPFRRPLRLAGWWWKYSYPPPHGCLIQQSESYITIDGQLASLSWNKAYIWGLRPDFYYYQTIAGLLIWGALWREDGCWLRFLVALANAVKTTSPRYIAPARTAQKTSLPLLHVRPLPGKQRIHRAVP